MRHFHEKRDTLIYVYGCICWNPLKTLGFRVLKEQKLQKNALKIFLKNTCIFGLHIVECKSLLMAMKREVARLFGNFRGASPDTISDEGTRLVFQLCVNVGNAHKRVKVSKNLKTRWKSRLYGPCKSIAKSYKNKK